jgi:GNAT superfamily N-acetyltransferase
MATIREAVAADLPAMGRILEEMTAEYAVFLPDVFQTGADLTPVPVENPDHIRFVADLDGAVVGFAFGMIQPQPPYPVFRSRTIALLQELGVLSAYRDRGIGTLLIERFTQWGRERGAEAMQLNVYAASPRAVAFYERHGFEPLGLRMTKPLG